MTPRLRTAGPSLAVFTLALLGGCASKSLPPDSLVLNGQAPTLSVRRTVGTDTALVSLHRIPNKTGETQHLVEVMSYIASRPLPEGDFELAKAFVRETCIGVPEDLLNNVVITSGAGGYYQFLDLPCDVEISPPFGRKWMSKA